MQTDVKNGFERVFGAPPTALFFAPGRVNLIGEHTDYNDGFVLPCAIGYGTYLALSPREDTAVKVVAGNFDDAVSEWDLTTSIARDAVQSWSDYLRGVCAHFAREHAFIKGMNIYVLGNVPRGAGLSSSASLSVAFATACSELNQLGLDKREIARICQHAESEFAGCNCGIMDQLASAAGEASNALLLDCRDLSYRSVSMPADLSLMIIDSKVERQLVGSEYNDRREDCERAARIMSVASLREADLAMLGAHKDALDDAAYRRARHVITENERTVNAAKALADNDLSSLHGLMAASHVSMRDDFEITVPEIDFLVATVEQMLDNNGGVRMTGGGFGGCVVALVPNGKVEIISRTVNSAYYSAFAKYAEIHICNASQGARQVS
ncbi:galactokinase [Gilvimarinus japonicus]|uniref:Galactokinase n=1 Tax=Gilvimarinus japonicus TaxID=1796469 RepID=A0ABV7HM65_9GAMM